MTDINKLTKPEFMRIIMDRDARNVYKSGSLILSKKTYIRKNRKDKTLTLKKRRKGVVSKQTGTLENALNSPNYFIKSQGSDFILEMNFPLYTRFLDMRHKVNLQIYNRIVWGIVYNNTLPDIRYGYGQEIKDTVGDMLNEAFLNK